MSESELNPNVQMIRSEGVRLIRGKIPRDVRRALSEAVAAGTLGHLKRDGMKPEAFFHPNSIYRAKEKRNQAAFEALNTLSKIVARPGETY